jgi:SNF2 family DNA or RNA helicase
MPPATESLEERLQRVRDQGDAPNLPTPSVWNRRFTLKPFQRVGVAHLAVRKRFVLGDPTGVGKTVQELYSWALIRDKRLNDQLTDPNQRLTRLWVVTIKSATKQWEDETHRFLLDQNVYRVPSECSATKRYDVFQEWIEDKSCATLIQNWAQFSNDWEWIKNNTNLPQWMPETHLSLDEIQKIKNPQSKLGQNAREILQLVDRVHGLTATLIKNKAHDAQAVMDALVPGLVPLEEFEGLYCEKDWQHVKHNGRRMKVRVTVGYHNLEDFKARISPYYLGRSEEEVEGQRPKVVFMKRTTTMSASQRKLYLEAEQGFLVNSNTEKSAAALGHAFQAACAPEMFETLNPYPFSVRTHDNAKGKLLDEILNEEIPGEPVIVYSPLRTIIDVYEKRLVRYNPVRITGAEDDEQRHKAKSDFLSGKTDVILITNAGSEAINLQRAKHLFMLTRPWDPGSYIQIVGRLRRFDSEHTHITVWHLDIEDSIDDLTDAVLNEKFGPVEEIINGRGDLLPETQVLPKDIAKFMRTCRLRS